MYRTTPIQLYCYLALTILILFPQFLFATEKYAEKTCKECIPGYIAYDGMIYDVSKSGIWFDGIHFFRHPAGANLIRFLKLAPHAEDEILQMPEIGQLLELEVKNENLKYKKIFYFLANFNSHNKIIFTQRFTGFNIIRTIIYI